MLSASHFIYVHKVDSHGVILLPVLRFPELELLPCPEEGQSSTSFTVFLPLETWDEFTCGPNPLHLILLSIISDPSFDGMSLDVFSLEPLTPDFC